MVQTNLTIKPIPTPDIYIYIYTMVVSHILKSQCNIRKEAYRGHVSLCDG